MSSVAAARARYNGRMMRRLPVLLLALLVGAALAQDPLAQLRDLLARGYYHSAARVTGPSVVATLPDSADAHRLFAEALYLVGDEAEARRELDRALALSGALPDPGAVHLSGLLRAAEGDLGGALRALENAFVRSRDYRHAMDWGRIAWQAGRYREALDAYAAAAETTSGRRETWPHLNRGRIFVYLGELDQAIEAFETAIAVFDANDPGDALPSPAYVESFFRLGEIYETLAAETGDENYLRLAATHYRSALSADPNYAPAGAALDDLTRRPEL